MKLAGHNVLAILAAAIVMYAIEFLIYGLLVPPITYQKLAHLRVEDLPLNAWKMPFGIVGPLLWATGLSVANTWRGAKGAVAGALTGVLTGAFFMVAARFYQWAYGATGLAFFGLDVAHFIVVGAAGGAILAAWPAGRAKSA